MKAEQKDPNGVDQHAPGAKLDLGKVRPSLILGAMPRALLAIAEVGTYGANKYSDGGWQTVPDGIKRYTDARDRHQLLEAIEPKDEESGLSHAAHSAWNAIARLELLLRATVKESLTVDLTGVFTAPSGDSASPVAHGGVTNADGWIGWPGGDCPLKDSGIEYDLKFGDGEILVDDEPESYAWDIETAGCHKDMVIAYRIHKAGE
jgi:hypothetical protein